MHFCTYCDHNYLPRALVLLDTLSHGDPEAVLYVVCLSAQAYTALSALGDRRVVPVELDAMLNWEPRLRACTSDRTLVEFYFTCTPHVPLFVMEMAPEITRLTYVDADLCFFGSPRALLADHEPNDILITDHVFPKYRKHLEVRGRHNVGLMSYRNCPNSLACLRWYADRCIEWCRDVVEDCRYADQKYLDSFAGHFSGVRSIVDIRYTLGPWNLDDHRIGTSPQGQPLVDGSPLTLYHFAGVCEVLPGWFDVGLRPYGYRMAPAGRHLLYRPYLSAVAVAKQRIACATGPLQYADVRRARSSTSVVRKAARLVKSLLAGSCVCM